MWEQIKFLSILFFYIIVIFITFFNIVGFLVGFAEVEANIKCNPENYLFNNWITGFGYQISCKRW